MTTVNIFFDNPRGAYFGGEMVTGKIKIALNRRIQTRGIELKFRGEALVSWEEKVKEKDEEGNTIVRPEEHRSHELYFHTPFYVLGGPTSEILLQPGEHMYNFSMQLPTLLPSSFEGERGYIRYTVKAILYQNMDADFEVKAAFTVLCHLDLNQEPNVKNPVMLSDDKFLCCCCCKSGPITCALSLPVSGYAPGQEIPFSLEVDNSSDTTISSIHLSLVKNVSFTVTHPKKETVVESKKVIQMVLNGVASNDQCSWTEHLEISSLPPSFLKNCSIIDITYNLEVEVKISGLHKNMFIRVPIVIGTIPIIRQASSTSGGDCTSFLPSAPPPEYQECILGATSSTNTRDRQNTQGNFEFVPCYPVYKNQIHS